MDNESIGGNADSPHNQNYRSYYEIQGYRFLPPGSIPEGYEPVDEVQVLFPVSETRDVCDFYGYILAVKYRQVQKDGGNAVLDDCYVFSDGGPFSYADFQKHCISEDEYTGGKKGIVLPWAMKAEEPESKEKEDGNGQERGKKANIAMGEVKVFGLDCPSVDRGDIRVRANDNVGYKCEICIDLFKLPTIDSNNTFLFLLKDSSKDVDITVDLKSENDGVNNSNEGADNSVFITFTATPDDLSDIEKAGVLAVIKVSESERVFKPGYIVYKLWPPGGDVIFVDSTGLFATVYFTSNWDGENLDVIAGTPCVKVKINGNDVTESAKITVVDSWLSKCSTTVHRPVRKGDTITLEVEEKSDKDIIIKIDIEEKPLTVFGPPYNDERMVSAKVSAENDSGKIYAKLDLDFKYYWFIRGRSRINVEADSVVSSGSTASANYLNTRGEYLCRIFTVKSTNNALSMAVGGAGGFRFNPEPEPSTGVDEVYALNGSVSSSVVWYVGNFKERKYFARIEVNPEYNFYHREFVPGMTNDWHNYLFVPASFSFDFGGIQTGFGFAGTYIWDYMKSPQVIYVSDGFHSYFSLVLTLSPTYVAAANFPIALDSQSMLALNLKLENGRKPPLMEDISSRMSFEVEFAPNIGAKKEEGE
ncbi:MAG: hypothetical protein JSW52_01400 [Candidatus Coatesbacteria bacterium]|nr:MAG: hypothetical protein JSW52_01400 [Candidatus Coatesbacteria bacterium]